MAADLCYHCALPVPSNCHFEVNAGGETRAVCCPGCKAVAELILASGMQNYYDMRDLPEPGVGRPEGEANEWQVFNRADMLEAFVTRAGENCEVTIYIAGMYCSACSWLIESTTKKLAGVHSIDINPVSHRARINFDTGALGMGDILAALAQLGYKPQPLSPDSDTRPELLEQRAALKRLLVASLGMMQVMMFAVALYAGEFQGIDADMQRFLRLVSFLVTTPVVFYSARPFFAGATRGLRARQPGMDLPVSIAIGSAYIASVYATFTNGPAVWFDSVTMFVFFLTVGRFLEMRARHRSIDKSIALTTLLPNTVTRITNDMRSIIPVSQLSRGDRILVRPGDVIPADGELIDTPTTVDESVLTGESTAREKRPGDALVAGSVNLKSAIELMVRSTGVDTTLGTISRLSERARYARPAFVQLADRVASHIVIAILAIAVLVAIVWYQLDPARAFVITLSVLVVTCPCALALATPAAFAAAGTRLAELKILVTNGNAIEALSRATRLVFDKTGTLTHGRPVIVSTQVLDERFEEEHCRRIAAALESNSTHPLARAFDANIEQDSIAASAVETHPGQGISGNVDGIRWRLGRRDFVAHCDDAETSSCQSTRVWLGNDEGSVAVFNLDDALREDAEESIANLRKLGIKISLLSGDSDRPVQSSADALGITDAKANCSPQDKLTTIRDYQKSGDTLVMVGDGINDAPVLAGADVSIAPAHASKLAQTSADIIILGDALRPVVTAVRMARRTMRIVRQNLAWAIVYNAAALPLASVGLVPPWAAAIGMSASSLIVVLNALRLGRLS